MVSCAIGSVLKKTIRGDPMADGFDLIQFNLGLLRYPRVAPELKSYEKTMDDVMPVALSWPGFLWIMDDDIIELTANRFGPQYASNLSGWKDMDSLNAFMVCPIHAAAMNRRDEWFTPLEEATVVPILARQVLGKVNLRRQQIVDLVQDRLARVRQRINL